jgi:sucrose phosphorylase
MRHVLDRVVPGTLVLTETNVPHEENISYFGNGEDEAQMVYNFTLPPLLLYSLIKGSAKLFSEWARTLHLPSPQTAFFNFTASHDGIGVRPLEGILSADEINWLAEQIRRNGGMVSEKQNPDGSTSPYELNTTYFDALKNPAVQEDPHQLPRFLASQAVALTLPGVPGVYIHSLLGTTNWIEGVRITGRARTINRKKLSVEEVHDALANPNSLRAKIFKPYLKMLRIRKRQPAFRPAAAMQVLKVDDRVFAVKRLASNQMLLAMTNFSGAPITLSVRKWKCDSGMVELLQGIEMDTDTVTLHAYQTMWLTSTPF